MRQLLRKLKRLQLQLGSRAHEPATTDGLVLLLLLTAAWWLAAQQGGARAETLPIAARLMLAALTVHGASLLIRREETPRVGLLGLAGAPFLAWLAIDAAAIAPDKGEAMLGLLVAAMAAVGWYLALHHARRTWSLVATLALIGVPAAILACGVFDQEGRQVRGLLGVLPNPAYAGHFISAFGSPGACAAVMLLGAMPALALALNTSLRPWKRVVAAYFGALLVLGLIGTHHAWAMGILGLGVAILAWRLCDSNSLRLGVGAGIALAGWILAPDAQGKVGILRELPNAADGAPWLAKAFGRAWLEHPVFGGGSGSFPLSFESLRPAAWQTDPASCGSLPLQIIAEHGLVGGLLLLAPVLWLSSTCLRAALRPKERSPEAVTASGGRSRAALRESLQLGATLGALGASLLLCVDYPGDQPGILLLVTLTGAAATRLTLSDESRTVADRLVPRIGLGCLLLPALLTPVLTAPLESAALAAAARPVVARFSPDGLETPALLDAESQSALKVAAAQLDAACLLNPLDGDVRAWKAQALALLVRQSPRDGALQALARSEAESAVRLNPSSPWARIVLASILLGSSEATLRAEGVGHLREAAARAPMNQSIALRVAQGLGQAGTGASQLREAYERALLTNPSRHDVRDKLTLLQSSAPAEKPAR